MPKPTVRVTGFTRFLLVMLFVAPLAYIGASYYNGQDGIQNFKNLLHIGQSNEAAATPASEAESVRVNEAPTTDDGLREENLRLKKENEALKKKLESIEKALNQAGVQTTN